MSGVVKGGAAVPRDPETALLTGRQAARRFGCSPAAIRKWVQRGHLRPVGRDRDTRANLYRERDVLLAERGCRRRDLTGRPRP